MGKPATQATPATPATPAKPAKPKRQGRGLKGWLLPLVGVLMTVTAVALLLSGGLGSLRAAQRSDAVLWELSQRPSTPSVDHMAPGTSDDKGAMPAEIVDGCDYLGVIVFPTLDVELPVAGYYSDEQLRVSPCRYEGSYETNDLIIGGEGYASHFGRISTLGIRDEVRFMAVDGTILQYQVSNVETDDLDDITKILHDWDLTLFTFNVDGSCAVIRCVRV